MNIKYRDATAADAAALADLFREGFCDTFAHLYGAQDLAEFLAQHTAERWREQLADPGYIIRLAEDRERPAGFAKLGPLRLPVAAARQAIELRQLYVLKPWQGQGVAAVLMDWVVDEAKRRGAHELYLSVFTENHRARRFYARYGFEDVGPYAFMVGNQADEDMIMRRRL
jgi:GNAT superfamily N-acetyltransferase